MLKRFEKKKKKKQQQQNKKKTKTKQKTTTKKKKQNKKDTRLVRFTERSPRRTSRSRLLDKQNQTFRSVVIVFGGG